MSEIQRIPVCISCAFRKKEGRYNYPSSTPYKYIYRCESDHSPNRRCEMSSEEATTTSCDYHSLKRKSCGCEIEENCDCFEKKRQREMAWNKQRAEWAAQEAKEKQAKLDQEKEEKRQKEIAEKQAKIIKHEAWLNTLHPFARFFVEWF